MTACGRRAGVPGRPRSLVAARDRTASPSLPDIDGATAWPSNSDQAAIRQRSSSDQTVIKQRSGSDQAAIRQRSGNAPVLYISSQCFKHLPSSFFAITDHAFSWSSFRSLSSTRSSSSVHLFGATRLAAGSPSTAGVRIDPSASACARQQGAGRAQAGRRRKPEVDPGSSPSPAHSAGSSAARCVSPCHRRRN
eukprot:3123640-Prymnesium_polylepis.1